MATNKPPYWLYSFLLNSFHTRIDATAPAIESATGPAYIIPSMPANRGRIKISGKRKKVWRVRDKRVPLFGLPMDVKKLELIGCIKLINVQNKKIWK